MPIFIELWIMAVLGGGNSSYNINIFLLQKKVIRIITGSKNKGSWHNMFRRLNILTVQSQYIFFIIMNRDQYTLNSDIQGINMTQSSNFHQAISDLTLYLKGTYHIGLKVYNRLPAYIKDISHGNNVFKLLLKMFFIPTLSTYRMSISDTIIYRSGSDSIIYIWLFFYAL
jgi:hypothetical protein